MADELMTPEQVAAYLKVTDRTVYNLLRAGKLRGAKVGRLWRVRRSDVDEYLRRGGTADEPPSA